MTVEHHSLQSSKQKLSGIDNSIHINKETSVSRKQTGSSSKQNTSKAPKNSLPPTAQSSLLNTTLMAMISQKPSAASKSNQKQKALASAYTQSKKTASTAMGTNRAKSANKGHKVDMFNSTAPIKFFSNLEETVREITNQNCANNSK